MSKCKLSPRYLQKDGPHSWIVLVTIILNGFWGGWMFGSTGIFAELFPDLLDISAAKASSLGSSFIGICFFTVPFNTLFVSVVGCRIVSSVGGLLILISVLSSAFGTQLWHLLISYSFIGGVGVSMNIASSVAVVPHYFEKKKAVAYACLGLGEGIAYVALPYILKSSLDAYGFKFTLLYMLPMTLLSLAGPIVFIPQKAAEDSSEREMTLVISYFSCLKNLVTPFYLANSLLWQGGLGGIQVLGFQYLVKVSDVSVALLCYSIMGFAYLVGSFGLVVYLLKFRINHFILQIIVNAALGAVTVILTFMQWPVGYYLCFAVIGLLYGLTVTIMPCVSAHLYRGPDVEYSFGFMQLCGGVGAIGVPIIAGILQEKYGLHCGMYFSGGLLILGAVLLVVPTLIKPKLWTPIQA